MKKSIIIALVIATTSLVSSCTKDNSVKPVAQAQKVTTADKTDVGQGD